MEAHKKYLEKRRITRRNAFFVQYLTIFLSSVGFSISLPAIWPYLHAINNSTTTKDLGLVIAIFSVGQLVGGPSFGFIAYKLKSFTKPLLISLILVFIGNFIYSNLLIIGSKQWGHITMIISRFILGFGSGNIAITRAFITTFSKNKEKTGRIATMSACQGLGFIMGPTIQILLSFLQYPGYFDRKYFKFNMYTGSAYLGMFTSVVNMLVVIFLFEDKDPNVCTHVEILDEMSTIDEKPAKFTDYIVVPIILTIFFLSMFLFSSLETILTPMIMDQFGVNDQDATRFTTICLVGSGIGSIILLMVMRIISHRVSDRIFLVCGLISLVFSCFCLIPLYGPAPPIKTKTTLGCPVVEQKWCTEFSALHIWNIVVSFIFFTFGFALTSISATVLFSKSLIAFNQTISMGLLTSIGSSSRIIGPFYVTIIYNVWGLVAVFGILAILNIHLLMLILLFFKKLPK